MQVISAVVNVGLLALCAGVATAAPTVAKQTRAPQRVDPTFVTPEYFIDGVWVQGQTVPYTRSHPADGFPCSRVVFDGAYVADDGFSEWIPGIDPCSGAGYLFASTTDTSSPTLYNVRAALMANDFADMDPFAAGKEIRGFAFSWHQFGTEPTLLIRLRWFDSANTTNSTSFGSGGIANIAAGFRMGLTFGYNGPALGPGDWYSTFDQDPPLFAAGTGFLDVDGGFVISAESRSNVPSPYIQFYMQGVRGTAVHPGSSNALMWIDDGGELGRVSPTHAYDISAVVANGVIQNTGTAATGNESYNLTDPTCFTSGLGPDISWWMKDCCVQSPATLVSPANGATGVSNPVTVTFTPPAALPVDFNLNIKLNGHNLPASMTHQNVANITLASSLDDGRAYGWSITSNASAGCPGADSETWSFRMAGCPADFNNDGVIDFFDYLDFVDSFSHNADLADFNADQIVDFFDYLDFVDAFSAGC